MGFPKKPDEYAGMLYIGQSKYIYVLFHFTSVTNWSSFTYFKLVTAVDCLNLLEKWLELSK